MSTLPAPDGLPTRLGEFQVTGVLGQGGSGIVYDARGAPRRVALKVLHATLVATDKEREQFLAEARRLQQIAHPAVVKVLSGRRAAGRAAVPRDGDASTARRWRRVLARGPLPLGARARAVRASWRGAVAALHEQGLVHRDLKPENVFVVGRASTRCCSTSGSRRTLGAPRIDHDPGRRRARHARVHGARAVLRSARGRSRPTSTSSRSCSTRCSPGGCRGTTAAIPRPAVAALARRRRARAARRSTSRSRRALSTRAQNRPASARALLADAVRAAAAAIARTRDGLAETARPLEVRPQATPHRRPPPWFDVAKPIDRSPAIASRRRRRRPRRPRGGDRRRAGARGGRVRRVPARGDRDRGRRDHAAGPSGAATAAERRGRRDRSDDPGAARRRGRASAPRSAIARHAPARASDAAVVPPRASARRGTGVAGDRATSPADTQVVIADRARRAAAKTPTSAVDMLDTIRARRSCVAMRDVPACKVDSRATPNGPCSAREALDGASTRSSSGRWSRDAIEACVDGAARADSQHLAQDGASSPAARSAAIAGSASSTITPSTSPRAATSTPRARRRACAPTDGPADVRELAPICRDRYARGRRRRRGSARATGSVDPDARRDRRDHAGCASTRQAARRSTCAADPHDADAPRPRRGAHAADRRACSAPRQGPRSASSRSSATETTVHVRGTFAERHARHDSLSTRSSSTAIMDGQRRDRPLVVGIAGGTGSGKTTVANKLAAAMPAGRCVTIEHDALLPRPERTCRSTSATLVNYDHPSSLESDAARRAPAPSCAPAARSTCRSTTSRHHTRRARDPPRRARAGDHRRGHPRVRRGRAARADGHQDLRRHRRRHPADAPHPPRSRAARPHASSRSATSTTRPCGRCTSSTSSRRSAGPT